MVFFVVLSLEWSAVCGTLCSGLWAGVCAVCSVGWSSLGDFRAVWLVYGGTLVVAAPSTSILAAQLVLSVQA